MPVRGSVKLHAGPYQLIVTARQSLNLLRRRTRAHTVALLIILSVPFRLSWVLAALRLARLTNSLCHFAIATWLAVRHVALDSSRVAIRTCQLSTLPRTLFAVFHRHRRAGLGEAELPEEGNVAVSTSVRPSGPPNRMRRASHHVVGRLDHMFAADAGLQSFWRGDRCANVGLGIFQGREALIRKCADRRARAPSFLKNA